MSYKFFSNLREDCRSHRISKSIQENPLKEGKNTIYTKMRRPLWAYKNIWLQKDLPKLDLFMQLMLYLRVHRWQIALKNDLLDFLWP